MRRLLPLLAGLLASASFAASVDPVALMQSVRDRDLGRDRQSEVSLVQTLPDGFVRKRELKFLEKDREDGERQSLLYFIAPADTAGTGLLMTSYNEAKGREDDQWLYLPALRKSKRVATNSKEGPFLGTDFSFADIERLRVADYRYKLAGEVTSQSRPCYRLEATTPDGLENPRTGYSRLVIDIDRERNIVLHQDFYRGAQKIKTFDVRKMEQVQGFWTVTDAVMTNLAEGGQTQFLTRGARYNLGLADKLFSQMTLSSGLR